MNIVSTHAGLVSVFAGPLVIALLGRPFSASFPIAVQLVALLAITALVAAVLFILTRLEGLPLSAIGLVRPRWQGLAIGLALALLSIGLIGPALLRMPGWLGLEGFGSGQQQLAPLPVWLLVLSILVVACAEEVLYRGYAIERLEALTGSVALHVASAPWALPWRMCHYGGGAPP